MMFLQIIFVGVFLKPVLKYLKTTGEHKVYYRLCESYRYENTVRHHSIVKLGTLDELPDESQRKNLAQRISALVKQSRTGICDMFEADDEIVESLAQKYFLTILKNERLDIIKGRDYETIDTHSIKNKNIREVGTEWICAQAIQQLKLLNFSRKKNGIKKQYSLH
ncbi:MAG: hypothetical protein SGJ15_10505 [Bacteroidota bacterium]|nr:hypothetical protein [Bacteroidota bacterium]